MNKKNPSTMADLEREMSCAMWRRIEPPLWWDVIQDHVIADSEIGEFRGHMVAGTVTGVRVVRGAVIVGAQNWPNALFSHELSHLSKKIEPLMENSDLKLGANK